jgi:ribonuclease VapC
MVIDTSALIAILLNEPETDAFAAAISVAQTRLISAVSSLETAIVIEAKKGAMGGQLLDELLVAAQVNIVAFDQNQFNLAREAYTRFGKGRHPAALNFGDCCAYALARNSGEPLLFKGQDFSATDIQQVVLSHHGWGE